MSKQVPAKQQRKVRAAPQQRNLAQNRMSANFPILGKRNRVYSEGDSAFANSKIFDKSTDIVRARAPYDDRLGEGVRVTGKQLWAVVTTTGSGTELFTTALGTISANLALISPDAFGGRLAVEARTHTRYVFRALRFIYTPRVALTQAGEFAMGYYTDGQAYGDFTTSFAATCDSAWQVRSSFHNGGRSLVWEFEPPKGAMDSYYCELDATSRASYRECVQGLVVGYPDLTSIGAVNQGTISVQYAIDLYGETTDLGFTLLSRIKSEEEANFLRQKQLEYRQKKPRIAVYRDVTAMTDEDYMVVGK